MRYLLDTNVLSEVVSPRPAPLVLEWLHATPGHELAVSVLSLGELERGLTQLPDGRRRDRLFGWARRDIPAQFDTRVLDVNAATALAWGRLAAAGKVAGRPLPPVDGLIVATAQVHDLTLVTRNLRDCAGRGVPTLDPWTRPNA